MEIITKLEEGEEEFDLLTLDELEKTQEIDVKKINDELEKTQILFGGEEDEQG